MRSSRANSRASFSSISLGIPDSLILRRRAVHLAAAIATQFVVDRLELLAQVILALIFLYLIAHPILDALLQCGDIEIALDQAGDADQPVVRIDLLEQFLALGGVLQELGRKQIGQMTGIAGALDHVKHFRGQLAARFRITAGQLSDMAHQGSTFVQVRFDLGHFLGGYVEEGARCIEGVKANPANALEYDLQGGRLLALTLHNLGQGAHGVDVACQRVIDIGIAVRDNHDSAVAADGFLDGLN